MNLGPLSANVIKNIVLKNLDIVQLKLTNNRFGDNGTIILSELFRPGPRINGSRVFSKDRLKQAKNNDHEKLAIISIDLSQNMILQKGAITLLQSLIDN